MAQEQQKFVEQRIRNCATMGYRRLNLGCLNLGNINGELLSALPEIEYLDLSQNRLTELPPEIWQLKNLKSLNLEDNLLTALPEQIGDLSNLELLFVKINKLQILPKCFTKLHKLERFDFRDNPFTQMPFLQKDRLSVWQVMSGVISHYEKQEALNTCLRFIEDGKVSVLDLLPIIDSNREKAKIAKVLLENLLSLKYSEYELETVIDILDDISQGLAF